MKNKIIIANGKLRQIIIWCPNMEEYKAVLKRIADPKKDLEIFKCQKE